MCHISTTMEQEHRKIIQDNMSELTSVCDFSSVYQFLSLKGLFTERLKQKYESDSFKMLPEHVQCQELLTDVQTRGPKAFSILLDCFNCLPGYKKQYNILHGRVTEYFQEIVKLQVKKSKSLPTEENVYTMTSYPRGYYIFINNIVFDKNDKRKGAELDEDFAYILDDMGYHFYQLRCHNNKTTEDMRKLLQEFSEYEDLTKVDSCIVVIGSHGKIYNSKLIVDGTDDYNLSNPLLCDEIMDMFNSETCKLRPGCPRIFIIQACRGDAWINVDKVQGDIEKVAFSQKSWKDTFLMAPCVEGLVAYRDAGYGSWMFAALKKVFVDHAHNRDLSFLKHLITDVIDKLQHKEKQTLSYYEYGVGKKLYFNPGVYDQQH